MLNVNSSLRNYNSFADTVIAPDCYSDYPSLSDGVSSSDGLCILLMLSSKKTLKNITALGY